jgi:pimeloyl-ACP methyl ester carboxylesterase
MAPGSRTAFLPQKLPPRYVKRSAAMLVLRPATLLANWADVGNLEAFLTVQAERYGALAAPTIVFAGDRDPLVPPARHSMKLAAATPRVTLTVLPGYGHMLHHDAAEKVVAAVEELAPLSPPTSRRG